MAPHDGKHITLKTLVSKDWFGWFKLCFTSHRQRSHLETAPHLISLAKEVKLGFYTVPTGNRTPGRCMAAQLGKH